MGAQKQNIFASETQILRLQDMLLGYANRGNIRETFKVSVSYTYFQWTEDGQGFQIQYLDP